MSLHAAGYSGDDRTLCGDASDAYESGDASAPIEVAAPGQSVTCMECKAIIAYARSVFTGSYRVRPDWQRQAVKP